MAMVAYDFEELEAAEVTASAGLCATKATTAASLSTGNPAAMVGGAQGRCSTAPEVAAMPYSEDSATPSSPSSAGGRREASPTQRPWLALGTIEKDASSLSAVTIRAPAGLCSRRRLSKARAWFEIKRFFDAEPRQYYGNPDREAWKIAYAKELLLSAAGDRLQRDGFVVIDAQLAPERLPELAQKLLREAPEQACALELHASSRGREQIADQCWVGAQAQAAREEALERQAWQRAMDRSGSSLHISASERTAPSSRPCDLAAQDGGLSEQDRALCDSCLLTLAVGHADASSIRPQSKQQFLGFLKAFIHVVSENSMLASDAQQHEKIAVQMCFGNISRPHSAFAQPLTAAAAPRPFLAGEGLCPVGLGRDGSRGGISGGCSGAGAPL